MNGTGKDKFKGKVGARTGKDRNKFKCKDKKKINRKTVPNVIVSVAVVVDREFGEEEEVVVVVEREGLDGTGTGTGIVPPRAENIPMTSLVYSLSGSRSILI